MRGSAAVVVVLGVVAVVFDGVVAVDAGLVAVVAGAVLLPDVDSCGVTITLPSSRKPATISV